MAEHKPFEHKHVVELLIILLAIITLAVFIVIANQAVHCGFGNHMVNYNGGMMLHYCASGWF